MFLLAERTLAGGNVTTSQVSKAVLLLTIGAAGGSAEAAWKLSQLYTESAAGFPKDLNKAIEYIELAQKNGFIGKRVKAALDALRQKKASK